MQDLTLGQSLLLIWPQFTGLVTATIVCNILSIVYEKGNPLQVKIKEEPLPRGNQKNTAPGICATGTIVLTVRPSGAVLTLPDTPGRS